VDLHFLPLDICGIALGSPYLYDRKLFFFRHENKYHLTKRGVEYIVRARNMRVNTTLGSAGKMKRIINTNKLFMRLHLRLKRVMSRHHEYKKKNLKGVFSSVSYIIINPQMTEQDKGCNLSSESIYKIR
jgi:hypothetical protein